MKYVGLRPVAKPRRYSDSVQALLVMLLRKLESLETYHVGR